MTTNLHVNDRFPDIALPNHESELTQLSHFTKPGLLDTQLGFLDGCLCLLRVLHISLYRPNEPCFVMNWCLHVGKKNATASLPVSRLHVHLRENGYTCNV